EQKSAGHNPRSTVGTITEVYDYLRLLWARVGIPHCPKDGSPIERQSASQITALVLEWPEGTKIEVLAPLVRGRKGEFRDVFEAAKKQGFVRVRVDGEAYDLSHVLRAGHAARGERRAGARRSEPLDSRGRRAAVG